MTTHDFQDRHHPALDVAVRAMLMNHEQHATACPACHVQEVIRQLRATLDAAGVLTTALDDQLSNLGHIVAGVPPSAWIDALDVGGPPLPWDRALYAQLSGQEPAGSEPDPAAEWMGFPRMPGDSV